MKKAMVVIDCRPDRWDVIGPYKTLKAAIQGANSIWFHLTERERKGRTIYAGNADLDRIEEDDFYDTFEERYNVRAMVKDKNGDLAPLVSIIPLMDGEIMDAVYRENNQYSNQAFFEEYCRRHFDKFGVPFRCK
jgi:hypothetical protein